MGISRCVVVDGPPLTRLELSRNYSFHKNRGNPLFLIFRTDFLAKNNPRRERCHLAQRLYPARRAKFTGIIIFFYILPLSTNKISSLFKHNKHVENYSKKYLEKVLSGENLVSGELEDGEIAQRYLYEDVELKEGPSKSVRIEASILNQLFEDRFFSFRKLNCLRLNRKA